MGNLKTLHKQHFHLVKELRNRLRQELSALEKDDQLLFSRLSALLLVDTYQWLVSGISEADTYLNLESLRDIFLEEDSDEEFAEPTEGTCQHPGFEWVDIGKLARCSTCHREFDRKSARRYHIAWVEEGLPDWGDDPQRDFRSKPFRND